MNSLFRRIFLGFIISMAVLLAVLGTSLYAGYRQSLRVWTNHRMHMQNTPVLAEEFAERMMRRQDMAPGRRILPETSDRPLFRSDAANRALLDALILATIGGSIAASAVAALAAWLFARSISGPAAQLAEGINAIAAHTEAFGPAPPPTDIAEKGPAELRSIAHAANMLSVRIQQEQGLRAQWARDIAHDLRTPVASVRARIEAIADGVYQTGPVQTDILLAELGRMEVLINDLEELIRLESPESRLNRQKLQAGALIGSVLNRFQLAAEEKNLKLDLHGEDISVMADEFLLERAVSNILSNAVRHAPDESRVDILVQKKILYGSESCTQIIIRNGGSPIPADELPRIFERLFRGEYARNTRGSGLGLTIARRIVQLHDGTIDVHSSQQEGTVFTISIPD